MKRILEDLHRLRFVLPLTIAAIFLLRWSVLRGRPERLGELPLGPSTLWTGVFGDESLTYGVAENGSELVAHARGLRDGSARLLVRHGAANSDIAAFTSGDYLYFVNVWYRGQLSSGAELTTSRHRQNAASKRQAAEPALNGSVGFLTQGGRGRSVDRAYTTLNRVPLAGGVVEQIRLDAGKPNPVFISLSVARDQVFWVRRTSLNEAEQKRFPQRSPMEPRPAHFELLATRLSGGPAKLLYRGIFRGARLTPSQDGVYWRVVGTQTEWRSDLVYVPAESLVPSVRKDFNFEPDSPPVIHANRLYWVNNHYVDPGFGAGAVPVRSDLVSANLDGTDLRVVVNLSDQSTFRYHIGRLYADKGKLYCVEWESPDEQRGLSGPRGYLCRLDPNREPVITKLLPLPARTADRGVIDRGYYYFVTAESQQSIMSFSFEGDPRPDKMVLYRWKLPDGYPS